MKLSTRGRYALRMMLDLARHEGGDRPVSLTSVAKRTGLSRGYLEQLALALRTAKLLRGVSGRNGGYKLARSAGEIRVGEIVEATIGPICLVECLDEPASCLETETCECRVVYSLINQRISEVLHSYTLSDLLNPDWVESAGVRADPADPLRQV
jgi:Rrf2 family protein